MPRTPVASYTADLDETRRLLYMTLLGPFDRWQQVAGTLVNALAHHGLDIPVDESLPYIRELCTSELGRSAAEAWAHELIDRITSLLDEA